MQLQKLLTESLTVDSIDCWENERTASALRALAVRLHSTGLSLRETAAVLECVGIYRSHQAIWQWVHRLADSAPDPPTAQPSRVGCAVGEAMHPLPDRLMRPINAQTLHHGGCFP